MNIIGVAGRDRSGKDTIADLLIADGWFGFSIGDATRKLSRERHADKADPISVANMTETSNWFRGENGADAFLKHGLKEYESKLTAGKTYKGVVIYSIRAPIEADFILQQGGELIWSETTDEIRHIRKIANMREGETTVTLQEMLDQEALQADPQSGIPREVQMDLNYVKSKATKTIENNGNDLKAFESLIKKSLGIEV